VTYTEYWVSKLARRLPPTWSRATLLRYPPRRVGLEPSLAAVRMTRAIIVKARRVVSSTVEILMDLKQKFRKTVNRIATAWGCLQTTLTPPLKINIKIRRGVAKM
jgi:hypothetical protein